VEEAIDQEEVAIEGGEADDQENPEDEVANCIGNEKTINSTFLK
jgi:hypothetical protein